MGVERRVILVRHLATPNNRNKIIMGRSLDIDIVRDEQVETFKHKVEALIQQFSITADDTTILSSPLKRCVTTSGLIKEVLHGDVPITTVDDLIETDMGTFEGQTGDQLREKMPELLDQWMFRPEHFQFPEGESYDQVSERVDRVMGRLLDMKDHTVFVCTHVDLIKLFLLKLQGKGFNERRSIDVSNGSLAVLAAEPGNKRFTIVDASWRMPEA